MQWLNPFVLFRAHSLRVIPETPPNELVDPGSSSSGSKVLSAQCHNQSLSRSAAGEDSIVVVDAAPCFMYKIPSFPVVSVSLRHIKVLGYTQDGEKVECDGFLHDQGRLMDGRTNTAITVQSCCIVDVEEFSKDVYIKHLSFKPFNGVYVIWDWTICVDSGHSTPASHSPVPTATATHCTEEQPVHTVRFKCMGANKDAGAQDVLKELSELCQDELFKVPVTLKPEPNNPYDSKAIAFLCRWPKEYTRIGYVVREALDSVHDSIKDRSIVSVKFSWVKFRVNWSGRPAYFAAINITKKGQWPPVVIGSASPL